MSDIKIDELQKLYDNPKVGTLVQEICEYYATRQDYEDGSYIEEIEPEEIVESVYMLFLLQRRETMLDELQSISKRYPNLFTAISGLYNTILIHMDVRPLEKENATRLSLAISEKASPEQIVNKIEELTDRYDDLSEALDPFYSWLHSFR